MFNKLLQAGETQEIQWSGSHVRIDAGSSVHIKTDMNETVSLRERETGIFRPFNSIRITNLSAAAETVEIRISTAQIVSADDGQVVALAGGTEVGITGSVIVDSGANESPDSPDVLIPAGTTVKIHDPAVYSCNAVEFYADEANTLNLRVWPGGDGTVVQGGVLQPGGGGEYSGALVLWAHNAGGTDQTINLTKLKRV